MVKSWLPSVCLTTAGIEPDVLGEHYDVWIQSEASINRDVVKKAQDLDAELWTYDSICPSPVRTLVSGPIVRESEA